DERSANRLRRTVVDVVDDRLHWIGYRGVRILLLQTMSSDPTLLERAGERAGVIVELHAKQADARIEVAWLESRIGKCNERVMLANGNELRNRSHIADERARTLMRLECENGFHFCVPRKTLRPWKKNRAAIAFQRIRSLL